MAFTFSKRKPVAFGDLVVNPTLTAELKLRLRQLNITGPNLDEARTLLSQCFGDKSEEVKEFIRDNFSDMDYARLQVYLLDGEKGVEDLERRMDAAVIDNMKEAMKKND